ncbi:hypothetical protein K402DRAFT_393533 [Aulographum hederae CBS 113979]|uniref:Uncharacterized protein n=1 Tax=Aulographum hederae CBS 113979 TaxID=1176131 RepID=A0A6G1H1H8_9PEZI|nr:hypothetical protein K402DRAFT_393533 [Aulographum hederae CBS 113979]
MSATRTEDATKGVSSQEGEFHSRVLRDEPLTTHGHKPGVQASEADRAPEFHAETLPPGSTPASRTFKPNPVGEAPPTANYMKSSAVETDASGPSADATLNGATTADVHTGLGHPGQGQTSSELRHDGQHHREKRGTGLTGLASGGQVVDGSEPKFAGQRAMGKEGVEATDYKGAGRGMGQGLTAEEKIPEDAEGVSSERSKLREIEHA